MAREFDQLESRRRAQLADPQYPGDLQGFGSRGTPPPSQEASLGQRYRPPPTLDEMRPSPDYIRRLFEQEMLKQYGPHPLQEMWGEPTRGMAQAGPEPGPSTIDTIQRLLEDQRRRQSGVPPSLGNTQLAGDVVPLMTPDSIRERMSEARRRINPGISQGSSGQQSIERFGGKQGPYLDLMDVLKFPGKRSEGQVKPPIEALSAVIPSQLLEGYMSQPAATASITEWSKAYDRLARMGAKPGTVALFKIATRNLGNTLGTKVSAEDFMGG